MQIRQRIFKHTAMKIFILFSRQNLQTFDISHAFLVSTANRCKVINVQKWSGFLAHPVCMYVCY